MFDYISISTKNADTKSQIEKFCINNNIDIESTVSDQGEILNSGNRIAYYKGIKIIFVFNGCVKLMFSLHKLYNDLHGVLSIKNEPMNHDTFDYYKFKYIFNWLVLNFHINPLTTFIHQIEFGFNLSNLPINTKSIINLFISYKGKSFSKLETIGTGNGIHIIYPKYYRFKIYDKALQYGLPDQILRIEYKALRIKPIENKIFKGDTRFYKLLEFQTWKDCKSYIIDQLDFCIIFDVFKINNISPSLQSKLLRWNNPKYWETCKADARSRNRKILESFVNKHAELRIKTKFNFSCRT